jgi:hypothetical protein
VRNALAGRTGKLIRSFKTAEWQEFAQMLLDACTIEQGTDDMELEGAARIQIDKYLSENPCILKPVIDEGKIAVSATDLQIFHHQVHRTELLRKGSSNPVCGARRPCGARARARIQGAKPLGLAG